MGCLFSKPARKDSLDDVGVHSNGGPAKVPASSEQQQQPLVTNQAPAKPVENGLPGPTFKRPQIDIKDLMIENLKDTAITKEQGKIQGQHVDIGDLVNCDVFICDHMDSVNVDQCEGCRIYIGPTSGAVFIRDCKDCDFVVACQQFRLRDGVNLRLGMCCMTQPSIETSKNIQIGCFDFSYFSLKDQIEKAGLQPWNNKWWQVHDFNDPRGEKPNWSLLPEGDSAKLVDPRKCTCIGADEVEAMGSQRVVPVMLGCRPKPMDCDDQNSTVIFWPESKRLVEDFIDLAQQKQWSIVRCRSMQIDAAQRGLLFAWDKTLIKGLPKKAPMEFTVVEFCGKDLQNGVNTHMTSERFPRDKVQVVPAQHSEDVNHCFFVAWDDMI